MDNAIDTAQRMLSLHRSECSTINFLGRSDSDPLGAAEYNWEVNFKLLKVLTALKHKNENEDGYYKTNILFSSFNIEHILRVLELGACGSTQSQLLNLFHASKYSIIDDFEWHKHAKDILQQLQNDTEDLGRIYTAVGLFVDNKYELLDKFVEDANDFYDAQVQSVDFENAKQGSVATMNDFVSEKTKQSIKNIIDESDITEDTQMFAINTVYFKGIWNVPFDILQTQKYNFNVASVVNGKVQYTPQETTFMFTTSAYNWYKNTDQGIEAIELPYEGKDISFLVIRNIKHVNYVVGGEQNTKQPELPLSKVIEYFEEDTDNKIAEFLDKPLKMKTFLGLPRLSHEDTIDLNEVLKAMGVIDIFQNNADLSRLTRSNNSKLSGIKQKVRVDVNEIGTTATSATTARLVAKGLPRDFICDYEFLYVIFHKHTNTVLFTGVYSRPPVKQPVVKTT